MESPTSAEIRMETIRYRELVWRAKLSETSWRGNRIEYRDSPSRRLTFDELCFAHFLLERALRFYGFNIVLIGKA